MRHSITLCSICFLFIVSLLQYSTSYAQQTESSPVVSTQLLQTTKSWNGADLSYPAGKEQITALHYEFAPGAKTSWHRHPVPSLAYIISGKLEVIVKDGPTKIFSAGDAFAEVVNTWHYGRTIGDEPVRLAVFYVGAEGMELTELLSEDHQ
jgi:quercetin dioxygenase-like cupin family protein